VCEIIRLLDIDGFAMVLACDWESPIEIELALVAHIHNKRIPERLAANAILGSFPVSQRNCIAEDVKTTASSRERDNKAVSAIEEANVFVVIASDQRQKDDVILLTLVTIDGKNFEVGVAAKTWMLLQLLQNDLTLAIVELLQGQI
jgi:hypothetical protein